MATLKEKSAEMARIKAELQRMETSEETTEESDGDLRDTLIERYHQLDEETKPIIARMEQIRAITRTASDPANLEAPDGGTATGDGRSGGYFGGGSPDLFARTSRNPYEEVREIARDGKGHLIMKRSDVRSLALDAIELEARRGNLIQEFAEEATRKAQDNPLIGEHMLLTGGEEYQETFRAYIENPQGMAQRAALSLTLANGGYLLPFVLDPTIILTNTGSANPWRRISNVKQTTSNTWNGVTSAGVSAAWLTEGSTATDTTPTVGNVQITPQKAAAWVFGNEKVAA